MEDSRGHRRAEAWLPRLLASMNRPRTRALVPEIGDLTRADKIDKALGVFRQLVDVETDPGMQRARRWSLEYFEACAEGGEARRQFLIDEGVFGEGGRLVVPDRVLPQMEIGNLEPSIYAGPFAQQVAEIVRLMFREYFGVKNLLSLPEAADLAAWIIRPLARRMSRPRLKLSLLLKDYVEEIVSKTRRSTDPPLVAIFGPGKGEEIVPLTARGLSVLCIDARDASFTTDLLVETFGQSRFDLPRIVTVGEGEDVDVSEVKDWERSGRAPTVFICARVDANRDDQIPGPLHGIASVSASIYLLHELRRKEALFVNMARISRGAVVVFDGAPSVPGLDNIILPVSERSDAVVTGHDAVVSHILSQTPEEMEAVARRAVPGIEWKGVAIGPPLPPPLFYKLQGAVLGHHPRSNRAAGG